MFLGVWPSHDWRNVESSPKLLTTHLTRTLRQRQRGGADGLGGMAPPEAKMRCRAHGLMGNGGKDPPVQPCLYFKELPEFMGHFSGILKVWELSLVSPLRKWV